MNDDENFKSMKDTHEDFDCTRVSDSAMEVSNLAAKKLYESDSDEETQRFHSNRRLESEKGGALVPETSVLGSKIRIRSRPFKLTRNDKNRKEIIIVSKRVLSDGEEGCETNKCSRLNVIGNIEGDGKLGLESGQENPDSGDKPEDFEPSRMSGDQQLSKGLKNRKRRVVMSLTAGETHGWANRSRSSTINHVKKEEGHQRTRSVKRPKATTMWQEVLQSPKTWAGEPARKKRMVTLDVAEDYEKKLMEFVACDLKHRKTQRGEALYRRRLKEKIDHSDSRHILQEFDISPARLEVLFSQLSDEMSAVRRLSEACRMLQWPQPQYSVTPCGSPGSFSSSCTIKTLTLDHSQPASNSLLANELAASQVLDWLAIVPHDSRKDLLSQTYF